MRRIGYLAVDKIVDHIEHLSSRPATESASREEVQNALPGKFSDKGQSFDELFNVLNENVFSKILHLDHPRFFGFIPGPGNYISAVADFLASGHNIFSGVTFEAAGAAQIEINTINWLCGEIGYDIKPSGGIFLSGGSIANLTGLAAARKSKLSGEFEKGTVYFSDQTHSSVERGLRVLGFKKEQIRKITTTEDFKIDIPDLTASIESDKKQGLSPFCVVGNAGTTNTGAIDPLAEISTICKKHDLWFHVDGAYGGSSIISKTGTKLLKGSELSDSFVMDPHKWMFQPYEIACLLVRSSDTLRETFQIIPEYLEDNYTDEGEINFCDYGIQLSRSFRALKLWLSLQYFGLDAFRSAVEEGFHKAQQTENCVKQFKDLQIITPAQMSTVVFRYYESGLSEDQLTYINKSIVSEIVSDGFAVISSTRLRKQTVLRMCVLNPRTTLSDVQKTVEMISQAGKRLRKDIPAH